MEQSNQHPEILWRKVSQIVLAGGLDITKKYIDKYKHIKERRQVVGKYPFIFKRAQKLKGSKNKNKEASSNLKIDSTSINEASEFSHLSSGNFVRMSKIFNQF